MRPPESRGPLSGALLEALTGVRAIDGRLPRLAATAVAATRDVLADDDVQVALTCLYELSYQGLDGVDEADEWDTTLLQTRTVLEEACEARLRNWVHVPDDLPAAGAPRRGCPTEWEYLLVTATR